MLNNYIKTKHIEGINERKNIFTMARKSIGQSNKYASGKDISKDKDLINKYYHQGSTKV